MMTFDTIKQYTIPAFVSSEPTVWDDDQRLCYPQEKLFACSKPTVWDDDLALHFGYDLRQEGSKPTVWDDDSSESSFSMSAHTCSKPTVWDDDQPPPARCEKGGSRFQAHRVGWRQKLNDLPNGPDRRRSKPTVWDDDS